MNLLVAALILLQDPVSGLISKIDGKDPEACFRAIAELADLGPERRAEIEKAAAKLPDFYRQALVAELKAGTLKRISIEGKGRTAPSYLEELGRLCEVKYWDPRRYSEEDTPTAAFDLILKDVPALEAVKRVCIEGGCYPTLVGQWYSAARYGWASSGRRALVVRNYVDVLQAIELGGSVSWRARLGFTVIPEPGTEFVTVKDVKIFEAVAKGGKALEVHPGNNSSTVLWNDVMSRGNAEEWSSEVALELAVPRGLESIERLKIGATGLKPTGVCVLEVPMQAAGKREDVSKDGFTASLPDVAVVKAGSLFRIRIRSNRLTRDELLKLPMKVEYVGGGAECNASLWHIRPAEGGAVDYSIRIYADELGKDWSVRISLPTGLEERPIFAEFRDIQLK